MSVGGVKLSSIQDFEVVEYKAMLITVSVMYGLIFAEYVVFAMLWLQFLLNL